MSNTVFPAQVRGLGYTVVKSPEDAVLKQQSPNWVQTRIIQSQNPIWHWNLLYDFLTDNPLKPNAAFTYTDLQIMLGFITARRDSYDDFLFLDTDDNFFGPAVITQAWIANYPFMLGAVVILGGHAVQVIAAPSGAKSGYGVPTVATTFTDGGLTWADLGAAIGGTLWPNPQAQLQVVTDGTNYYSPLQLNRGGQFYEDITDLASALTVYANGVASSAYQLSAGGISIPGFSSSGLYLAWGTTPPAVPVTAQFNYYYRVHFEDDTQDFEKWANQWWTVGGSEGSKGKGELKLVTSRTPSGQGGFGPGGAPFPPFGNLCGGNVMVIYPGKVTLTVNGAAVSSGPTGAAMGQAGQSAWFNVRTDQQVLGSVGGVAVFSAYKDPGIARARICGVYSWTPYAHIPGNGGVSICTSSIAVNGAAVIGGITNGTAFGSFLSGNGGLVALTGGGVTPANIDFTTITQQVHEAASVFGSYGDSLVGNVAVLVYYT